MPYLFNHRPRTERAKAWTKPEDLVLRENYATESAYAVGKRLGRSEGAVWLRARALGLSKRPEVHHPWTDAELAVLAHLYSTEPAAVIAERLGRTPSAVAQQGRALGLVSNKSLVSGSIVTDYFHEIDTAEKAYILGLLAADGNVGDDAGITFGLQAKDGHLVRFVHAKLAPKHALSVTKTGFVSFTFVSHQMAADLARWGIVPRKSRVITWPSALGALQRHFLLGYFDGDGSTFLVRGRYPGWSVCSGSQEFLLGLRAYTETAAGIGFEKMKHRPQVAIYELVTTGSGAYTVDNWLHQDGLGLARKRFAPDVLERYSAPAVEGRTRNGVASRLYSTEFKNASVEALREVRKANGVVHGDVTRVARQLGVNQGNLRNWLKKADAGLAL